MRVRLTSAAWLDLAAIGDWLATVDERTAVELTDDLLDRALEVGDSPYRFPAASDDLDPTIRKRSHRRHVIVYRVLPAEIEVLHIVHARRDYLSLIRDL